MSSIEHENLVASACQPPVIHSCARRAKHVSPTAFGGGQHFLDYQADIGARGSKQQPRAALIDALSQIDGSLPPAEHDAVGINSVLWWIYSEHMRRMLSDEHWRGAFAKAGADSAARGGRVLVIGIGSAAPALSAARAGADVLWVERVSAFASIAEGMAHSLKKRLRIGRLAVRHVATWNELPALASEGRFTTVITEEVGDDPLSEGLLLLALTARRKLLVPGGRFVPSIIRVHACPLALRTTAVSGFDLRAFNAFRNNESSLYDAEHACVVEGARNVRCLAQAAALVEIDLNSVASISRWVPSSARHHVAPLPDVLVHVSTAGVLNSVTSWAELELSVSADSDGPRINLGPPPCLWGSGNVASSRAPRHKERRARRQQLRFLGYERSVVVGDHVTLTLRIEQDGYQLVVDAPATLTTPSTCTAWPRVNLLGYHFQMIADGYRNGAFDRALVAAISRFKEVHGRGPRVLDIGSGSGLLALMSARAGASEVHSLEMVPAMADVARHVITANGFANTITIHSVMSTKVDAAALGGRCELLVCEIVDDMLLGESVLTTVADARRRLLTKDAIILPQGGAVWALAVELLPPAAGASASRDGGLASSDTHTFQSLHALSLLTANPNDSVHLQFHEHRPLGPPVQLATFDWAHAPLDTLTAEGATGASAPLPLRVDADGCMSALIVYLTLDLDGDPGNIISTAPDSPNLAWEQVARHMPMALRVRKGDELTLVATYTDCYLQTLALSGFTADMLDTERGGLSRLIGAPSARGLSVVMEPPRSHGEVLR